jgi:hypothetical protein
MIQWLFWALVLTIQNGAFTWVSRARNSGSPTYHFKAALASNGTWWLGQGFVISIQTRAIHSDNWKLYVGAGLFYALLCALSSVAAHIILMRYIETGKRKVGA